MKRAARPPGRATDAAGRRGPSREGDDTLDVDGSDPAQAAAPAHRLAHRRARDRHRRPGEGRPVQHESVPVPARRGGEERRGLAAQVGRLVGQERRGAGDHRTGARVEARLEVRQQLVPHAVAHVDGVGVRRVLPPLERARVQVSDHLVAGDGEERPEEPAPAGAHRREARRPRPAQEAQQERLGLVVASVRYRDRRGLLLAGDAPEKPVARASSGGLEPAVFPPGPPAHVRGARPERYVEVPAQRGAEGRVVDRGAAQAVVEVGGHEPEAAGPAQERERVEERDGVGAARKPDDERLAAGREVGRTQGAADGGDERGQPQGTPPGTVVRSWWRCRDSNPGRRGYEPRALTS